MKRKSFLFGLAATGFLPFAHGSTTFETAESDQNLPGI